ncbi:branched-chain amino acid ABC transporter permease [Halogranum rubrum]|nr:branched-chain amino acid ABC transporter permease [Halogranum salarium]
MGIADNTSRGRQFITERPMVLLGLIVGLVVLFDLGNKLMTGQVTASTLFVLVWRGIVNGLVIGLAGVGLSMTYSILNFANFAHGDYISSGAFAGWAATWVVAGLGVADIGSLIVLGAGGDVYSSQLQTSVVGAPLAIIIGIVVAGAGAIALSLVVDRLVYKPMRNQDGIALLIASIGVAFILRYLLVFVFGSAPRSVAETPPAVKGTLAGVQYSFGYHELTLVICAIALMVGVHLLLQRTKLGKAMRAMSDNKDLARVTGIPTEQVIRWTWVIGAGLAGVAGYLLILESGTIAYNRGWILLLLIFAAVILGGIGSIYGAILGGLVIGLADTVSLVWLPSEFTQAAAFGLMILILLFKPNGLFAGRTTA